MNTQQLKQKILDLAIRGKLVPQNNNEESASVLLERIRKTKAQLVADGKIKKSKVKTTGALNFENVPFDIPDSWVWVELDELAQYKKGPFGSSLTKAMFVPKGNNTYKVYEQQNAIQKDVSLGTYYISETHFEELKGFEVLPNDIIVSCAGTIGETFVLPQNIQRGIINQALMYIRLYNQEICDFYLIYFDSIIKGNTKYDSKGTAMNNIPPFDVLKKYLFPLPPLAEQQRIVETVKKCFALIDEIDANKKSLQENIEKSKLKILSLAINGKLAEQNPKDESATELLIQLRKEKELLIKQKLIKKGKKLSSITDDELPSEIPEKWCWCRLDDIARLVTKGTTPRGGNVAYTEDGIGFLRAENVAGFHNLDLTNLKYIDEDTHKDFLKRSILEENDILITIAGSLGKTAIVRKENLPLNANQAVSIVRLTNKELVDLDYLVYALNSPEIQDKLIEQTKVTAIPNLTLEIISSCVIPLPPLAEQKRIVKKIDESFKLFDAISAELQ